MMQHDHDPYLRDLLRPRRSLPWRLIGRLLLIMALGGLGLGAYSAFGKLSSSQATPANQRAVAMSVVSATLLSSVEAARAPLRVSGPVSAELEQQGASPIAARVVWESGKPVTLRGKLAKNESVFAALQKRNLENQEIHTVISQTAKVFNFRQSRPGDEWSAEVDEHGAITRFQYKTSPEDIWETARQGDGTLATQKVVVPVDVQQRHATGAISSSLWRSLEAGGLSTGLIHKYMDVFSHTVDFGSESQPGDQFGIVYEEIFLEGKRLRDGKVLAAAYRSAATSRDYYAFFYESEDGEAGFYDEQGNNLQRQFLKSPLGNVRITSPFGKRFHPILKKWKAHNGVDYGAPTGTPVMSVADGTVSFAGVKGANGKLVVVKHPNGYSTHYAHLSAISPGMKPGAPVTKKTVIGRVGSTGRSTGPHLHFGMQRGGRFIDPLTVDFMRSPPLQGGEKERFVATVVTPLQTKLQQQPATQRDDWAFNQVE